MTSPSSIPILDPAWARSFLVWYSGCQSVIALAATVLGIAKPTIRLGLKTLTVEWPMLTIMCSLEGRATCANLPCS